MIERFFFGGVTPNGFATQLTQLVSGKEYYSYILKGGPGTGKSHMMRAIAERFSKRENVTCFYCSSDPDSLDAVILHASKVIVVDGTPPHVSEPRFPGICQEIVYLGQCWDKAVLKESGENIIKASELNKSMMAGAANYNKALGLVCDDTYACAERFVVKQGIEEAARVLCENLFENRERRTSCGKRTIRQLSVMTRYGYKTLPDAAESCRKLYILDDELFAASCMLIDFVAARAMDYGYDTKLSQCLLSAIPISEHLMIDEVGAVLMTSNPLTQIAYEKAEHIDCSIYYDEDQMRSYDKHFATNRSLISTISDASREMLDDAKRVHDEMEQYYIGAMDFNALNSICEKLCDEIERIGHR
ncbi:MAG: hypothetical protein Q4D34_06600 [Eggerthellaceae bacterium]|nr:hypothetical protein [Eggerthellaceae bacterium]